MSVLPEDNEQTLNYVSDNKVRKRGANMEPSEHGLCLYQAHYFEIKSIQFNIFSECQDCAKNMMRIQPCPSESS